MLNRRDAMLRLGGLGLGSLTLPQLLSAEQSLAGKSQATAKSCILIYLWGGPPQQDMWDMKPEAPVGIKSEFSPIDTVVPGIQICDQMPFLAKQTDKLAVIRSYTHPSTAHEPSVYHTMTGRVNNTLVVPRNMRSRNDFPNMSSVVSYFSPPSPMPAAVTVPRPIGHDGVVYAGTAAGFLGAKHDPLEMKASGEENAKAKGVLDLPQGLDAARIQSRFGLLHVLEQWDRRMQKQGGSGGGGLEQFREQAFRMLASPAARTAFDLDKESDTTRERYGRNEYGESMLLARRLVEAGVRMVNVIWYYIADDGNVLNVWDNHGGTGSLKSITGYQMLKEYYCLPSFDQGFAALLQDLSQRGMLDETMVAVLGEFGRTPLINKAAGREHWGPCQSVILAGGGIRGGQVYGASDKHAAYPASNPVSPEDFIATCYQGLGIDPQGVIHDSQGRPHRLTEGEPVGALFG